MKRRLYDFLTALSLLLCLAVFLLWARSFVYWDRVRWNHLALPTQMHFRQIQSAVGRVFVTMSQSTYHRPHRPPQVPPLDLPLTHDSEALTPAGRASFSQSSGRSVLGVTVGRLTQEVPPRAPPNMTLTRTWVVFPHAYPAALFAILPATGLVRRFRSHRRRRRGRSGLCPRCGYDLTANASGVCPECGVAVAGTRWP